MKRLMKKKLNDEEFVKISKNKININTVTIKNLSDKKIFDPDSVNLLYTLPNNIKEYSIKSKNDIVNDIYTSYDLSLNTKYKVKIFNQTIDRVKNYFR